MQELIIKIGRESDGDMIGKLFCHIADTNDGSGCKYYLNSLEDVGDTIREYIKDNFEDDGADVCYRVR